MLWHRWLLTLTLIVGRLRHRWLLTLILIVGSLQHWWLLSLIIGSLWHLRLLVCLIRIWWSLLLLLMLHVRTMLIRHVLRMRTVVLMRLIWHVRLLLLIWHLLKRSLVLNHDMLLSWLLSVLLPKLASLRRISCLARTLLVPCLPSLTELHVRLRIRPRCRFRDLRRGRRRRTCWQGGHPCSCSRLLILGHIRLWVPIVQRRAIYQRFPRRRKRRVIRSEPRARRISCGGLLSCHAQQLFLLPPSNVSPPTLRP